MDFTFSADQLLFHENVHQFFTNEVTPELIRELWDSPNGRSDALWAQLVELGLPALSVPEEHGGLGLNALDFVLIAQECGYAGLPEPLVDSVLVGAPLLAALDDRQADLKDQWLPRLAAGAARLAVGEPGHALVADAHVADLLLLPHGDEVHAVPRAAVALTANPSLDPSRRLFRVDWTPGAATCVAAGEQGRALWAASLSRGSLGTAAQLLGLAMRMLDLAVDYSFERKQFGKPVGSFQAVKHLMANVAVQIEFAKPPLYRAAYAVAYGQAERDVLVAHARLACGEAALLAAKHAIQVHGAMGYTWEMDLQIFMKRAWALDKAWGGRGADKTRIREALFGGQVAAGAGNTFAAAG